MSVHESDELIILLVEKNSVLYDRKMKGFKDEKMKENIWKDIAALVGNPPDTVKKRWENLRDRFVRCHSEASRGMPSESGATDKKPITFPYYDQMMFLVQYIRKRKLISSAAASQSSQPSIEILHQSTPTPFEEGHLLTVDVPPTELTEELLLSSAEGCASTSDETLISEAFKKKPWQENVTKALNSFTQIVNKKLNQSCTPKSQEDESDVNFMKSVVADMSMIEKRRKVTFKKEVLELLDLYINNKN